MKKLIVLYHASCNDGFAAAWATHRQLGDGKEGAPVEYRPVQYGYPPPDDLEGNDVFIVDFSFHPHELDALCRKANTVTLLDHHKTAFADCVAAWGFPEQAGTKHKWERPGGGLFYMDQTCCGARLAWIYWHPNDSAPWIIDYVEDRDLWTWKLQDSKAISAYLTALPREFAAWDDAIHDGRNVAASRGEAILMAQQRRIEAAVHHARPARLGDHVVPTVNCTTDISEVVGELAEGQPFAIGWFHTGDKYVYSLRSRKGGVDVSAIAKAWGGGGHENAAGFSADVQCHRHLGKVEPQ